MIKWAFLTYLRQTLHSSCSWVTFGSSEAGSYVQLVAVDDVVSVPVNVEQYSLSKGLIREVTSHTEIYD